MGKSSIALRFCQDRFDEVHDVTIGGAYLQKIISIQNPDNPSGPEQQVKMHIWDTGGHERFRSMINMYYRDAIGAIICYDLTNEASFRATEYWVNEMKTNNTAADQEGFIMALAGNKCDLPIEQHRVSAQTT